MMDRPALLGLHAGPSCPGRETGAEQQLTACSQSSVLAKITHRTDRGTCSTLKQLPYKPQLFQARLMLPLLR